MAYAYDQNSDTLRRVRAHGMDSGADSADDITVFADASHSPSNKLVYGYGLAVGRAGAYHYLSGIGCLPRHYGDNHLAELLAAATALDHAIRAATTGETIRLLSDSVNALCVVSGHVPCLVEGDGHCGNAGGKRKRFNLRMSPIRTLNPQAVASLSLSRQQMREKRITVTLEHVKAHTGLPGEKYLQQHICDMLARCARSNAERLFNRGRLVSK
jgi:ribonuclease HI